MLGSEKDTILTELKGPGIQVVLYGIESKIQIHQHRPQIAKNNFCVINVENSVTSARSSRQNSLLFSWASA